MNLFNLFSSNNIANRLRALELRYAAYKSILNLHHRDIETLESRVCAQAADIAQLQKLSKADACTVSELHRECKNIRALAHRLAKEYPAK